MQNPAPADRPLRVVVVEDDDSVRLGLVNALEQLGYQIAAQATTGPQMVEMVLQHGPDIVLFDIHLPGLSGLDALRRIFEQKQVAAVAITGDRDGELLRKATQEHVLGYLIKPFEHHQVGPAIEVAYARFAELSGLSAENNRLQKTLEARKLIERAKGVLMKRHRWGEAEAFRRLQRAAMNQRTTMADLARQVLDGVTLDL